MRCGPCPWSRRCRPTNPRTPPAPSTTRTPAPRCPSPSAGTVRSSTRTPWTASTRTPSTPTHFDSEDFDSDDLRPRRLRVRPALRVRRRLRSRSRRLGVRTTTWSRTTPWRSRPWPRRAPCPSRAPRAGCRRAGRGSDGRCGRSRGPRRTMPGLENTLRSTPPHDGHSVRASSVNDCFTSMRSPHDLQAYSYLGIQVLRRRALAVDTVECQPAYATPLRTAEDGAPLRWRWWTIWPRGSASWRRCGTPFSTPSTAWATPWPPATTAACSSHPSSG